MILHISMSIQETVWSQIPLLSPQIHLNGLRATLTPNYLKQRTTKCHRLLEFHRVVRQ